jgi:predicted MFS family arabinose efflux permease
VQGGLIGRLVERFGESTLVVTGALLFTASLFVLPFTGPQTGLFWLLFVGGAFAFGQSLATPADEPRVEISRARRTGRDLGRHAIRRESCAHSRPLISAALIYSAIVTSGADRKQHNLSDQSLLHTFWTAAFIMLAAFLLATYFARRYSVGRTKAEEVVAATTV